jgi:hypothetical protein
MVVGNFNVESFPMRSAVLLVVSCLLPPVLAGQSPDSRGTHPAKRFSLVLEVGGSVGGPGAGLTTQLRQAGFIATTPRECFLMWCSGPTAYPTQEGPGVAVGLTARFAISRTVAVAAGYGTTSLGGSTGYRASAGSRLGGYVSSDWNATMVWAGVFWTPHPALRLGGGPGRYQLENFPRGSRVSQVGLMGEAGADLPAGRRFFLNLAARVHFVPAKDVAQGETAPITLRPHWTHVSLLAGLGVRL